MNINNIEHRFDGPAELAHECDRLGINVQFDSWTGGLSKAEVYRRLHEGDETFVPAAEAAIQSIMRNVRLETLRTEWENDLCGAFADVPAFLAGNPASMRRKVIHIQEQAPIRLFVSLTSSAGVSTTVLQKRGICLLALVMALHRLRPVELWTFNAIEGEQRVIDLVRMPTSPIDIGLICFIMTNMSFTRGLCYEYCNHYQRGFTHHCPNNNIEKCRALLGVEPQDVVFPPIHLYDDYRDPEAWVRARLAEILKLNEQQIEELV